MERQVGDGEWSEESPAWRDDVALELWVDAERSPVLLRLAGTLDESTSRSLLLVVGDLIDGGARHFELCSDGLRTVEPGGSAALVAAEGMVERSGGTLRRVSAGIGAPPMPRTVGPGPSTLADR